LQQNENELVKKIRDPVNPKRRRDALVTEYRLFCSDVERLISSAAARKDVQLTGQASHRLTQLASLNQGSASWYQAQPALLINLNFLTGDFYVE
jgi:hypothetical protein